ncbi:hypothetical protein LWE61_15115 [Sphingobium sufflavum]|uniref:hypothetical protein n=1 Tax=Sphingobium sufflavum TaxID=1129547 RepID=UPI001F346BAD|nr:hypothetical protein [Sphingobium sufflavum]MCE7797879.1 hypothetical protein [Sphingobium sufflavum]
MSVELAIDAAERCGTCGHIRAAHWGQSGRILELSGECRAFVPSDDTYLRAAAPLLVAALEALLDATVEADLSHGVALSNEEAEARQLAQAAIAAARGVA